MNTSSSQAHGRVLIVMRHAKALSDAPSDHERPLAPRGHAEAGAAGAWMGAQGYQADAALVSDARRTQETWLDVAAAADWDLEPTMLGGLYTAGTDTALDLIRETDDSVTTLVLVGHNPTVATLAELIDDGDGDQEAVTASLLSGFAPSSVAVFSVAGRWGELDFGGASLRAFHAPST